MSLLLVIEDEARLCTFLVRVLQRDGHTVEVSASGPDGLERALGQRQDLIILDLMLPGLDGFEVLARVLEQNPEQRVLVLSAVGDVHSRVRCLRMGAVDFLAKPFATAELVERVRARLRVTNGGATRWLRVDDVALDLERQALDVDGEVIALSHREFVLLEHLMRRAGRVCTRDELLSAVWGYTSDARSNVIDVTIGRVRGKARRPLIHTVRNVGYLFSGNHG